MARAHEVVPPACLRALRVARGGGNGCPSTPHEKPSVHSETTHTTEQTMHAGHQIAIAAIVV
jgi:hypothetical protein